MRTGHWIAIDCVVAAFSALLVLISVHRAFIGTGQMWLAIGLLMAGGVFLPVALRRQAPVMAFGGLLILAVLFGDMATGFMFPGAAVTALALVFLSAAYVLYTVTVTSSRRTGGAALGAGAGAAGVHRRYRQEPRARGRPPSSSRSGWPASSPG